MKDFYSIAIPTESFVFSILLVGIVFLLFISILVAVFYKLRKRGGSMTTVMLGATYELHGEDKKRAIEAIVEQKAGDKLEEEGSCEPKNKG